MIMLLWKLSRRTGPWRIFLQRQAASDPTVSDDGVRLGGFGVYFQLTPIDLALGSVLLLEPVVSAPEVAIP